MILFMLLIINSYLYAGFTPLNEENRYSYKEKKAVRSSKKSEKKEIETLLNIISEQDKQITEYLRNAQNEINIRTKEERVDALTRVNAVVLNSIISSDQKTTKFLVKVEETGDLENGELRCLGISFHKRISAKCDLLVIRGSSFQVDVEIWGTDGAEGIIPDHIYSGEEKSFITSSLASFFAGVLDSTKDKLITPNGIIDQSSAKNSSLNGLLGVAKNASNKIQNSGEDKINILFANSGKKVLAFFNKELVMNGEKQ